MGHSALIWPAAMSWTGAEDVEDMEGMLSAPPTRAARRWPWLVGATAALCVVGIGVRQFESVSDENSIVDHVSMVHGKISTILAAASEKSYDSSVEMLLASIKDKGKTFPQKMGMKAKLKIGGDGKSPKVLVRFGAKSGKVADLKTKLNTLFEDGLKSAPPKKVAEIKKAVTMEEDGDSVIVTVVPPKKEFKGENEKLKAALKTHKPEFSADFAVARTIEDILEHKSDNVGVAVHGIEAKVGAVFMESIIDVLSQMPLPPPAKATLGLVRSSKLRNEIYYDDDRLPGVPLPKVEEILGKGADHGPGADHGVCSKISPKMAEDLTGLQDELKEVQQAVLEGLPYGWEMTVDMTGVNPGPLAEFCAK